VLRSAGLAKNKALASQRIAPSYPGSGSVPSMMEAWGTRPCSAASRPSMVVGPRIENPTQVSPTLRAVVDLIEIAMSDMPKASVQAEVRKANGQVV
jgi:hypothetical protein